MTKTLLTSLLVGAHFRPPAKQILESLPAGQELGLLPEPENPYDASALAVLLDLALVEEVHYATLDSKLEGTGATVEDLLAVGAPLHLGYVAASGGKPLLKAGLAQGNREFLALLAEKEDLRATLAFTPAGLPLVLLSEPI